MFWFLLVSCWNGFIIVSDFFFQNLLFLLLLPLGILFVILELKEDDSIVNDERKLV